MFLTRAECKEVNIIRHILTTCPYRYEIYNFALG
jgi:hypothetical protein